MPWLSVLRLMVWILLCVILFSVWLLVPASVYRTISTSLHLSSHKFSASPLSADVDFAIIGTNFLISNL